MNLVLAISPGIGKGPFEIDFELGRKGSLWRGPDAKVIENDTMPSTF